MVRQLKGIGQVKISHVLREGNTLAYFFTNLFYFAGDISFYNFLELPIQAKKIINVDKSQIPIVHTTKLKRRDLS